MQLSLETICRVPTYDHIAPLGTEFSIRRPMTDKWDLHKFPRIGPVSGFWSYWLNHVNDIVDPSPRTENLVHSQYIHTQALKASPRS